MAIRKLENELRSRQGRDLMPAIPDEPELFEDLLPVWNAWTELLAERNAMGGGIPWSGVSRWCEDHGINGAERLRWCRLIRAIDLANLTEQAKRK